MQLFNKARMGIRNTGLLEGIQVSFFHLWKSKCLCVVLFFVDIKELHCRIEVN